ncbi:DUF397 domain-containing protein [Actinoallomurus purpureus]|uniref:DUF397 domain-containing protein n=1 Tax=Actinoallomurus purpureus TaxID=478114 RepID=UPI0020930F6E|nr:DUF397 domain-containing protein [Actinoallomurus purpureus]MCO6005775.1 DUF397 domain-containing protein [Actinoallomurus purpureus]
MDDVTWQKASRSTANGGNCVELAVTWRKAARSTANGGDCVEVAVIERAGEAFDRR